MVNAPSQAVNGAQNGLEGAEANAQDPKETQRLQGLRNDVVMKLIEKFEEFFDERKMPIPRDKYEMFREFTDFIERGRGTEKCIAMYDQVVGKELKYDDIKFLGLEYDRLSRMLLDRDIRQRLGHKTQTCIIEAFANQRAQKLAFAQGVTKEAKDKFVAMIQNTNEVNTFEQLDTALHAFFEANNINEKTRKDIRATRIGIVDMMNLLNRQQQIDPAQQQILRTGALHDLQGPAQKVINDLLKIYTIQDVVDLIGTAEKEAKDINTMFTIPTLGSIYSPFTTPFKVLDDKKLQNTEYDLKAVFKKKNPSATEDEKSAGRMKALLKRMQNADPDLARITERILAVGGDLNALTRREKSDFFGIFKKAYLKANPGIFQKLEEMFTLPRHQAEEFVNAIFDPDATQLELKTAHGEPFILNIKKNFLSPIKVGKMTDFANLGVPFNIELSPYLGTSSGFKRLKNMWVNTELGSKEAFFRLPGSLEELHPDFAVTIRERETGATAHNVYISKKIHYPTTPWDARMRIADLPFTLEVRDGPMSLDGKLLPTPPVAAAPGTTPMVPGMISSTDLERYDIHVENQSLALNGSDALKLLASYGLMRRGSEMSAADRAKVVQQSETVAMDQSKDEIREKKEATSEDREAFRKRFSEISGDPKAEFNEGTELFLDVGDSFLEGGGRRYWRISFCDIDEHTGEFKARLYGCEIGGERDGEIIDTFCQSVEDLDRLIKGHMVMNVYKFRKQPDAKARGKYVKEHLKPEYFAEAPIKSFVDYIGSNVFINSLKSPDTKEPFAYFGEQYDTVVTEKGEKKPGTIELMYKVDYTSSGVRVSSDDEGRHKDMTMNEFMLFCAEKGLRGYTQKDYDTLKPKTKGGNTAEDKRGGGMQRFSLGNIIGGFKATFDGIKGYLKEQDDERSKKFKRRLFTSGLFKSLSGLPVIGDAFGDMTSGIPMEIDKGLWADIEKYRDECESKGGLGSAMPAKYIVSAIFENADTIRKTDPLKVAGCLLYAMGPKGGSLYFRELKKYKGTGMRVKMLLGPQKHEERKVYHETLRVKLSRMSPTDTDYDALADDFAKSELRFIFGEFNNAPPGPSGLKKREVIFGTKFPGYIQGQVGGSLFSKGKIDEVVTEVSSKKFSEVYTDEFVSAHNNLRMERVIGTQMALGQKVLGNEPRYYRWCFAMLAPLISGVSIEMLDKGYKGKYEEIAKMFGFPFAEYINNMQAQREMTTLFDAITTSSQFEQIGDIPKKFSSYVNYKDPKYANNPRAHEEIFKKMEAWRGNYGKQLMDKLQDYGFLFDLIEKKRAVPIDQQRDQFEIAVLENYINKGVLNSDTERFRDVDTESIIYKKHMFSLSPGLVRQAMDQLGGNGRYTGNAEKTAQPLRQALNERLSGICEKPMPSAAAFNFYAKKYFQRFGSRYPNETKQFFLGAAKFAGDPKMGPFFMRGSVRRAFDKMGVGSNLPSEVSNTLIKFEKFFLINAPLYICPDGKLSREFTKNILDYEFPGFDELTPEDMIKLNKQQNAYAQSLQGFGRTGEIDDSMIDYSMAA